MIAANDDVADFIVNSAGRLADRLHVSLSLVRTSNGLCLDYIAAGERRGDAARVIEHLVQLADDANFELELFALDGAPGLVRYYRRFGFEVGSFDGLSPEDWDDRQERLWQSYLERDGPELDAVRMFRAPREAPISKAA